MKTAVIGVGNEYRRDDGVGPAVVARLAQLELPQVALIVSDGEPSQLIDAWTDTELTVLIDAVLSGHAEPGRVHRTSLGALPTGAGAASTHGVGIPEAVRLADALDRAPRRLVVYAVEAADLGFGVGLSPAVAASVEHVAHAVVIELMSTARTPPGGRDSQVPPQLVDDVFARKIELE
jgi:hydrogenase maturation protease